MTSQKKFGFMRQSKFRHIFGQPLKREQCYENIKVTKQAWESTFCVVNPKFLAVITASAGGGSFLVLPLTKFGRLDQNAPLVCGHKSAVLDISWSPFNDHVIASASEDCSVKVWEIPEDGLKESLTTPEVDLKSHTRKVGVIIWHPTASNILCSGGADCRIVVWNVETEQELMEVTLPDIVLCLSFNYNGSKLVTTCKDKVLRVLDPRTGELLEEGVPHQGSKSTQAVYVNNGQILTTGFSRTSERQCALWNETDLSQPVAHCDIDNSNGVLFPFYDPDTSVFYLCGKGDASIRYYEITDEQPYIHYLDMYQSNTPMRGFGYMHKRGLNVNSNEIARIYKIHNTGFCEVIPFTVPRKSELFQDDLYPDTAGDIPALTADEWFNGKDADPIKIPLKGDKPAPQTKTKLVKKSIITKKKLEKETDESEDVKSTGGGGAAPVTLPPHDKEAENEANSGVSLPEGFDAQALLDDTRKLKLIVKAHERRIKALEDKIALLEQESSEEEEVAEA